MTITIKNDFSFEETIKKSRFLCHLKRVTTEDEAREFITAVKKQHYKANHNVSAFTLGNHQEIQRSSDDGEPSGTAGVPMLEILKKREIINVVAVVTRYFGGVKLGAGGLIRAYAGSVNHALDAAGLVQIIAQTQLDLQMDYGLYDHVVRFLTSTGLAIADTSFTDRVAITLFVNTADLETVEASLIDQFHGKVSLVASEQKLVEVPL